ncbi:SDR family NAD(P)-dependent oxidoreductase [Oceanicella actignis]|uniref:3-dehydrosphinganine reductase n=1 Tax=Oceanicella actignis TaxID=1189325 RepID=A0A1M7TXL1_9RHOB|nr:SDR family NAD(P)-dependent oxidoreductase [Oceanicella actignis]SET80535.1 3-dehydrosphinganine reductase [Oceanicella actignis]SHN75478.1 3-dehydrosphinganine reductase [Oceanicella actignis]
MSPRRLTDGHAFVSGGSSGIGLAAAELLARRGAPVTLAARDPARLSAAAERVRRAAPGARVRVAPLDVTDAEAAARALREAEGEFGPVETLILSAGATLPGRFEALPPEAFRALMEVNYFGALNLLRPALAGMRARRRGAAGLVGSGAGLVGVPGYAAYGPTKFALRGLAETLRAECAPFGVGVTICHPPDTDTPQLAAERPLKPPELAALSGAARVRSAEEVARALLRGMARGRAEVFVGAELAALGRLGDALRPALRLWTARAARRARRAEQGRRPPPG